ncbi:hypothetical protein WH87_00230 [Devosia epidermidihirudinis]|uniref:FUSC family protein n=1 Tax=Devosia epidermidihirudinis TaxID=1293439 RepID=A0A0F5QMY9_9HYPH|nr:hypothetical protein [Devosia epidermidihirudinis]KKC41424.1 hypothetical protein WH87_00230 [Devosia epidermidihirudinis]
MFIAAKPQYDDDPLFPIRIALMPIIGFVLGMALRSPMAMIYPTLMFSLLAGNRKAFDPRKVFAAPIVFSATLWIVSGIVVALQGVPLVLMVVMFLIYFGAFFMIQKTGNPFGMLIAVAGVLTSVMGLGSYQAMDFLRTEMSKAAILSAVVIPLLYALLPPKTSELNVDAYVPSDPDGRATRALIRAGVLFVFSLYLYTILDFSNMFLAVAAMFVMVFSTRETMWAEVGRRQFSVLLGGGLAMCILTMLTISGHLIVLLCLIFLATLWLGHMMMNGKLVAPAYQDAASVMISLTGSALATSEPSFAFIQRAGLTIIGTIVAGLAVSVLDHILVKRPSRELPAL